MTKEIIDYSTRDLMKVGKKDKHSEGLRSLHTDFINNDESQGYRVTFVNGLDDPSNDPILVDKRNTEITKILRMKVLIRKLEDDIINDIEIRELLKLEFIKGI